MGSSSAFRDWPIGLRRAAEAIGPELAIKLGRRVGGLDGIYIPKRPSPTHPWATAIGVEAFAKLIPVFGGKRVTLSRGVYVGLVKRMALGLIAQDFDNRKIALLCQCTERYVRQLRAARRRLCRARPPRS
jgi:hypothetical protein